MIIVSYGGGTNSTALLVGMVERDIKPDAIIFADTGGEKPHTYEYVALLSDWLVEREFPAIEIVRWIDKTGKTRNLEQDCLQGEWLPSIAYGFKGCSVKYKIQPQEAWAKKNEQALAVWESGGHITKYIGYDFDEQQRARILFDDQYQYRYPLIEWQWGREECVEAIKGAGLPLPGKSACFFCPNTRPSEIRQMQQDYPDLIARAIEMEDNADLTSIKGLGRGYSWKDLLNQEDMFGNYERDFDMPCGCFDGD